MELTHYHRKILTHIRDCTTGRGYPPTVAEIGKILGLSSTSSTHRYLVQLEQMGLVTKDLISKKYVLTAEGRKALGA